VSGSNQRASGVILKVERAAGRQTRLTINTNAVWRDWSRDQAKVNDTGPAKKDAARGENSVATIGEPADKNSLVVVDVVPDTRVETRFRSPEVESSKGSKEPAKTDSQRSSSAKPVQFRDEDLNPGLFVEVDFSHSNARNPASTVLVIRPIGGPASGAADRTK
jgi:hypothetical protein